VKEKELRLALVCYGGISLAVYIHAATREVLKLARASRAYHDIAEVGSRTEASFSDTSPPHQAELDTESVYFDLLKTIGKTLDLRVVVDVVAGASAGGINAIILARALAHDLPIAHLRELWLKEADVAELIAREARARAWSKWYLRPVLWMAFKLRLKRLAADAELRSKLSIFLRSRWFKPPFDGPHLAALLFDGIGAMGQPPKPRASLMPVNQQLELFVTLTDFHGYQQRIGLHDPPTVTEREHRHILRFAYRRRADGREVSELATDNVPALAFAGRATASFPGAFPPAQIAEMDRLLKKRGAHWPGREAFVRTGFPRHLRAGADPLRSAFIDGSVTNNKPFAEAIASIRERPAHRDVDRRLVYIDPHPVEPGERQGAELPGFFRTLWGALSDIPRNEPVHDELAWINDFNAQARRVKTIVDAARPHIDGLVAGIAKGRINRSPSLARLSEWRDTANALAAQEAGFAYEGYVRLKLIGVVESLAELMAKAHGLSPDSQETAWLVEVLGAWTERRGLVPETGLMPKAKPGANAAQLPDWVIALMSFDYEFRRRRLHFVIQRLNGLYGRLSDPVLGGITAQDLDHLKRHFYEALARFGATDLLQRLNAETVQQIDAVILGPVPDAAPRDAMPELAALHVETRGDDIDMIVDAIAEAFDLAENDRLVDEIFAAGSEAKWTPGVRRELLVAFVGFSFWDVLTFSVTQRRNQGEFDPIRVDRISPDDATAIRAGTAETMLKGVEFRHFGAFFSRAHRENDYLWGRLHAADRLIDIVSDAARDEQTPVAETEIADLKRRAFLAILDAEKPHLDQSAELIAALRREIGAGAPAGNAVTNPPANRASPDVKPMQPDMDP